MRRLPFAVTTASTNPPARGRDAERTRGAILDAAEKLFMEQGYARTTLSDVGAEAGLSRGAAAYFFDSKLGLYRAVVERTFQRGRPLFGELRSRGADIDATDVVRALTTRWLGEERSIRTRRLIDWEAPDPRTQLAEFEPFRQGMHDVLGPLEDLRDRGEISVDPRFLLVALSALVNYPFLHHDTTLAAIGVDVGDPGFIAAYTEFVVSIVASGALAPPADRRAASTSSSA